MLSVLLLLLLLFRRSASVMGLVGVGVGGAAGPLGVVVVAVVVFLREEEGVGGVAALPPTATETGMEGGRSTCGCCSWRRCRRSRRRGEGGG